MYASPWTKVILPLIALVLFLTALAIETNHSSAQSGGNLLTNGNFERGFTFRENCGGHVAIGWGCFTNRGQAVYGFYDDKWPPVVADGGHSQLIEINTKGLGIGTDDRYAGLYQTVRVVPGAVYQFSLRGMIRSTTEDAAFLDPWRYRVQFGYSLGRQADWRDVTNWVDVGWDLYDDRLQPTVFNDFSAKFFAQESLVTLYVRVWKKWGTTNEEIDINFDDVMFTRSTASGSVLPLLTATPTQVASPLLLPNGTPIISLPEQTPDPDIARFVPPGMEAIAQWPRYYAHHVAFAHPGPWAPVESPLNDTAIIEKHLLGIPGWDSVQSVAFYDTPLNELDPPDVLITTTFPMGVKTGIKWIRQGPSYVGYQYCATGLRAQNSFCIEVTTPVANPMLELQLDYLARSLIFY